MFTRAEIQKKHKVEDEFITKLISTPANMVATADLKNFLDKCKLDAYAETGMPDDYLQSL